MARTIPMPPTDELPEGPRRDFVLELRRYYRAAGRPPLRKVSQEIERHPDPELKELTASAETIRRMITGKVLPVEGDRVQAVFRVLCKMARVDPDAPRWEDSFGRPQDIETNWHYVQRLWDNALEEGAYAPPVPRPTPPASSARPNAGRIADTSGDPWSADNDPWAADAPGGYSDEPPF